MFFIRLFKNCQNTDFNQFLLIFVLMGWTPFFRTSNELKRIHLLMIELEHLYFGFERTDINHQTLMAFTWFTSMEQTRTLLFSNIRRTRTCSSFGNQIWTPYFWLRNIEHQTLNTARPITNFLMPHIFILPSKNSIYGGSL